MRKLTIIDFFVVLFLITLMPQKVMCQEESFISKAEITTLIHTGIVKEEMKIIYRSNYSDPNLKLYSLKQGKHILFSSVLNKGYYVDFDEDTKAFLKYVDINKHLAESAGDFMKVDELIQKYENVFRNYFKDERISFHDGDSLLVKYLLAHAGKVRKSQQLRIPLFVYIGEKIRFLNNWQWEVDFGLNIAHSAFVRRKDGNIFNPMELVNAYFLEGIDDVTYLINLYINVKGGL